MYFNILIQSYLVNFGTYARLNKIEIDSNNNIYNELERTHNTLVAVKPKSYTPNGKDLFKTAFKTLIFTVGYLFLLTQNLVTLSLYLRGYLS